LAIKKTLITFPGLGGGVSNLEGERRGGSDGVSSFVNGGGSDQTIEQPDQQSNFGDAGTSRQSLESPDNQGKVTFRLMARFKLENC